VGCHQLPRDSSTYITLKGGLPDRTASQEGLQFGRICVCSWTVAAVGGVMDDEVVSDEVRYTTD
jgi:hypothetical protein